MARNQKSRKRRWHAHHNTMVRFLSFVYISGAYGLFIVFFIQACVLFSWLQH